MMFQLIVQQTEVEVQWHHGWTCITWPLGNEDKSLNVIVLIQFVLTKFCLEKNEKVISQLIHISKLIDQW